jgi:hypothetical protein
VDRSPLQDKLRWEAGDPLQESALTNESDAVVQHQGEL